MKQAADLFLECLESNAPYVAVEIRGCTITH